jgi:F-type H+-transporting ATPase subunit alpha
MRSQEIGAILRRQIEGFEETLEAANIGQVVEVGDGIARIWGLSQAMAGELLEFPVKNEVTGEPVMGIALNLDEDTVGAIIVGP